MSDRFDVLERYAPMFEAPEPSFERFLRRRDRKRRTQRIAAGVVGIAVFLVALWVVMTGGPFDRASTPADDPRPEPPTSDLMWPQTSLEEVRQAQELADAGDPAYTWQVDPKLVVGDAWAHLRDNGPSEIVARFLREELGWEGFRLMDLGAGDDVGSDGTLADLAYIRCAPDGTNPLYPNEPAACAPTIDERRYETGKIDLTQLDKQGVTGIWVVTGWTEEAPFAQTVPPVDDADALLGEFAGARIEGHGAERYFETYHGWSLTEGIPLLYGTTTGAPYERYELELVDGPHWPYGEMEYMVRLFADDGQTVVEQRFWVANETGSLGLEYRPTISDVPLTTQNGQPVAETYGFFDGDVTMHATIPWAENLFVDTGLALDQDSGEQIHLLGDPAPVGSGCEADPVPTDADALARSIRSDPDVEATAPVAVTIGGTEALQMDVTAAPGASACEAYGTAPMVLQPDGGDSYRGIALDEGNRVRLYLLDMPQGSAIRVLAIGVIAPEERFEQVMQAAAPVLDSLELRTP